MDGYEIDGNTWKVYQLIGHIKHYRYGYKSYKEMIAAYPELHDFSMVLAIPLLN